MKAKYVCLVSAFCLAALTGCGGEPSKPRLGEVDRLPHVEVFRPEYKTRPDTIELLATVDAMEKAQLAAQVPGEVKDLSRDIDIGRPIKKGEELLTLDIPATRAELENKEALLTQARNLADQAQEALRVANQEVEEAKAQVARYQADQTYRETQLRRGRRLAERNAIQPQLVEEYTLQRDAAKAATEAARVTVDTKRAKVRAAQVELRVASSRIKVAEADVKLAKAKVNFATVRAPFDGLITRRLVDNGAVIKDPGTPLFTVVRTDIMRVIMDIPERYVRRIRAAESKSPTGEPNRVVVNIHGYVAEGRITRLASNVDETSRLMRAEVHVRNDEQLHLRAGMTGTAMVYLDEGTAKRLTVPSTALVRFEDKIHVYYVDELTKDNPPRGKVKAVEVEVGLDDGKTVEILKGLKGDEQVIAKGNGVVRQGETAIPVKARERKQY
jgi:RND family efflux transporter MFP subunit